MKDIIHGGTGDMKIDVNLYVHTMNDRRRCRFLFFKPMPTEWKNCDIIIRNNRRVSHEFF